MATIEERLKKVVADHLTVDEQDIVPTASFVDDLHADSFDLVKLLMGLEDEFAIKIKPEEMENLTTVGEALLYLQKRLTE